MPKPNPNEKDLSKKTSALLKRAASVAADLNLYMLARDVDELYQESGRTAAGAIELAVRELNKIIGFPAEVPADAATAEG